MYVYFIGVVKYGNFFILVIAPWLIFRIIILKFKYVYVNLVVPVGKCF